MRERQYPIDTAIEKFVDLGIVIFERLGGAQRGPDLQLARQA
jgi:hypothetical protein